MKQDPFKIIHSRHITEKSTVLQNLVSAESNTSVKRCQSPKYVFLVDVKASKPQIASAVEAIYSEQKVKVTKVNTLIVKSKRRRVGRGRPGLTTTFKKAVVTLEQGDRLDQV